MCSTKWNPNPKSMPQFSQSPSEANDSQDAYSDGWLGGCATYKVSPFFIPLSSNVMIMIATLITCNYFALCDF